MHESHHNSLLCTPHTHTHTHTHTHNFLPLQVSPSLLSVVQPEGAAFPGTDEVRGDSRQSRGTPQTSKRWWRVGFSDCKREDSGRRAWITVSAVVHHFLTFPGRRYPANQGSLKLHFSWHITKNYSCFRNSASPMAIPQWYLSPRHSRLWQLVFAALAFTTINQCLISPSFPA
jgi:hypothetical protein